MKNSLSTISASKPRSALVFGVWIILLLGLTAALIALGTWQVKRLRWKEDLIARLDARIHAAPQPAPGIAPWSPAIAADAEYLRVIIRGVFLNELEAQVYASTDLGPGYWVMTPLKAVDGTITIINRGFVPLDHRQPDTRTAGQLQGETTVTGLLRLNEPRGTMLRSNVPADDRWYSRDVDQIAAARGIKTVAPYFIDADATPNPGGMPVGGLTQVVFPNSHLSYAITWYVLAAMTMGMMGLLIYTERRRATGVADGDRE